MDGIYEFVFRMAAEGMVVVEANGVCGLINPAAALMLDVAPDEVRGQLPKSIFPDNPNLVRLLRQGGPVLIDIPLSGDRVAQGVGQDLPDGRRVALLTDATDQRQFASARARLASRIAHDLRNPLNALSGYADLVGKFGDLTDRQAHFLRRIYQTSEKLWQLAPDLVELAWIEAGMPLQYIPFDLVGLIQQVVREMTALARENQVHLVVSTQDSLPTIMGDPGCVSTALAHLVENGILYSPPLSNVVIHAWQQEQRIMCSVADRGYGIAEEELDLIWDRMWRSPDERVMARPGGGMGLVYVRTLIERHGGEIWVESILNAGATFTFYLPFEP